MNDRHYQYALIAFIALLCVGAVSSTIMMIWEATR